MYLETLQKGFELFPVCSKGCTFSLIAITEKGGWIQFNRRNSHFKKISASLKFQPFKSSADCSVLLCGFCEENFDKESY